MRKQGGTFLLELNKEVFTPEKVNEDQQMIRKSVEDFVNNIVREKGHYLEYQEELMRKAAEMGLLGAHIPKEYDGGELEKNIITIILEELGKAGGSFDTTYAAHTGIGMLPILYYGNEEQKSKWLPLLAGGEHNAAYCLTEPWAGSDAQSIKSTAIFSDDGDYIINGQKMWISNAGFADLFIFFAKVNGEKFTCFLVPSDTPGITLGEEEEKLGIKGSSTRQVFFEEVKVPKENVLGEIGEGLRIAFNVLNIGRFKLGALTCGGSKYAHDLSITYANDRVQFGKPISSFGAIKYKIALQALKIYALESAIYRLSGDMQDYINSAVDSGKKHEEALREVSRDYAVECAIVKVAGSECLDFTVDELLQIYGGYGYSEEYPPARAYRDARINRIYEGTNEINRLLSVNLLLKKALSGNLDLIGPAWEVQKELTKMSSMRKPSTDLADEAQYHLKQYKKLFLLTAGAAVKKQMDQVLELREEQLILTGLADMLIPLYLLDSSVARFIQGSKNETESALIEWLLHRTGQQLIMLSQDLLGSYMKGDERRILLLGINRFTSYPIPDVHTLIKKVATSATN